MHIYIKLTCEDHPFVILLALLFDLLVIPDDRTAYVETSCMG